MSELYRRLGQFEWSLAAIGGGLCLLGILALTVLTVFGRYILQTDLIPGAFNMIESVLFPVMVFWGLPLAHREATFPRLEILDPVLKGAVGKLLAGVVLLVEVCVYAIVAWYCARYALNAWNTARALQIGTGTWPAWPVAMMAPLAFVLMLVEAARLCLRDFRAALSRAA